MNETDNWKCPNCDVSLRNIGSNKEGLVLTCDLCPVHVKVYDLDQPTYKELEKTRRNNCEHSL